MSSFSIPEFKAAIRNHDGSRVLCRAIGVSISTTGPQFVVLVESDGGEVWLMEVGALHKVDVEAPGSIVQR